MDKNLDKTIEQNIVMAFGTFDLFHEGHKYFLSEAKKLGDKLFVVVARDQNVLATKSMLPRHTEEERLKSVKNANLADKVMLGYTKDKMKVLQKFTPQIIALGFDQEAQVEKIRKILPKVKIIRLSAYFPQKFKSSILRKKIDQQ